LTKKNNLNQYSSPTFGFDPKLSLTLDGCKKRDEVVLTCAKQLHVPIVCTMGGGYSPEIRTIIEGHANTFRTVFQLFE
jgi:acetoin utilization deacetylase AcuC-like enzyme